MTTLEQFEIERYSSPDWQEYDIAEFIYKLPAQPYSANWSEMGAFKTTTGLWLMEKVLAHNYIDQGNVLIVTTKSGKGTYWDAIPKTLSGEWRVFNVGTRIAELVHLGLDVKLTANLDLDDFVPKLIQPNKKQIVVAHYNCFTNKSPMKEILRGIQWDFVLLDEAHRIKNKDTQWTRNLKQLSVDYKHVMTGTGFINDPSEMWSILNFLDRRRFSSYHRFRRHYCLIDDYSGFEKVVGVNPETVDEFRTLRKEIGPRRTMQEVHSDIAEPVFTPYEVDLNSTQRKMYNEILEQLRMLDKNNVPIHSPNVLSQLSRLRQICVATPELVDSYYDAKLERLVQKVKLTEPSSKLDSVMEIIEGLEWDAESKQQAVIFSNFKDPLELLKVRLDAAKVSYIHMEEKDNDQTRYEKWHDQFPAKTHQLFLSTLQLGSESINLACANYAIFLDRSFSPKDNNQGVARIYRPGQQDVAQIIHINARKTVDQKIEKINIVKTGWFRDIFGDDA